MARRKRPSFELPELEEPNPPRGEMGHFRQRGFVIPPSYERALKLLAVHDEVNSSYLVREALYAYLKRRRGS